MTGQKICYFFFPPTRRQQIRMIMYRGVVFIEIHQSRGHIGFLLPSWVMENETSGKSSFPVWVAVWVAEATA